MTPFTDLMTEREFAAERGVTVRTLQRERAARKGPPFVKMGRRVLYRRAAVAAWIEALEQTPVRSELLANA